MHCSTFTAPANAATLGQQIAATALAEDGNGACAHGGYDGGPGQSSSCSGGQRTHAWCADFAGWVWAQNGVTGLGTLDDLAASFYEYGLKYGTVSSTPHVGDAVVYNYGGSTADDHVAIVTGISGNTVTITGGNQGSYPGKVSTHSTTSWGVGSAPFGKPISGYISPVTGTGAGTQTPPATPAASPVVHLHALSSDQRIYGNNGNYSTGGWSGFNQVSNTQGFSEITAAAGS
ncbi:CHAP domain-containing protein [Kitasatospora purpeofusca]|uniref:CHAP domain-containing protein n=1 Tax=Kitasatospora purpeofusca TaxID=67352 RepID=UPI0035E1D36C